MRTDDMTKIRQLDSQTVSKIAAGEIIENPASVCKELVENSIDAGATNIKIQLSKDLLSQIRITDDGEGISEPDTKLAFLRHATSKLSQFEDLENLLTLGFRGEALASIANVSKVTMITRTEEEQIGRKVVVGNGEITSIQPIGAPLGTSILIEDLFYNVPVRKKYLKSTRTELDRILNVIEHIALSHPEIGFLVQYQGKTLLHSHANTEPINHIYSLLGKDIAQNLIELSFETASYKIHGYISNNKLYRSTPEREYLFVNGRSVQSPEISKLIRKKYHTLIPLNRYPVFILYLELDPVLVDVNIHPTKKIIKISDENYILTILDRLIDEKLYPNREIPQVSLESTTEDKREEDREETIFDLAKQKEMESKAKNSAQEQSSFFGGSEEDLKIEDKQVQEPSNAQVNEAAVDYFAPLKVQPFEIEPPDSNKIIELNEEFLNFIGIVFKTYIIFEDSYHSDMLVIDQHAAHERILFEEIYRQLIEGSVHRQVLIEPILLEIGPRDRMKLRNSLEVFESIGFKIEVFGEDEFVLREVPTNILLKNYNQFIQDALHKLTKGRDAFDMNLYEIMRMACRKAIKAGDKISEIEAYHLIKELKECKNPYTCPHGRPTVIKLNKRELEKLFLREG